MFSQTITHLYIEQLKCARNLAGMDKNGDIKSTAKVKRVAHKILGTSSFFGDSNLQRICEEIDNNTQFNPGQNHQDRAFVEQFKSELDRTIAMKMGRQING